MKSGYCTIMWNGRDHSASEMKHHQPHPRPVFIQSRWCCIYGGIGRESSIMSFFRKTKWLIPTTAEDARDSGLVPGSRRSPGVGSGTPLQYSCLENSVGRGAWQLTVHGAAKSWTWLSDWAHTHTSPLHMNLQVTNFQRESVLSTLGMSEIALSLLLLMILQLYHLPPSLPPTVTTSSCLFT